MSEGRSQGDGAPVRISRRSLLGGAAAAGAAVVTAQTLVIGVPPAAAAEPAAEPVVGSTGKGRTAVELLAKIDQEATEFIGYGYLTFIHGLNLDQLFTDPSAPSESTARFTVHSSASLVSRVALGDVHALDLKGSMSIYFDPNGGASFEEPDSFKAGTRIMAAKVTMQDILSVIAPNQGIPTLGGDVRQTLTEPFTLEGTDYQLGRVGLLTRLNGTGRGVLEDAQLPRSSSSFAANLVVVDPG